MKKFFHIVAVYKRFLHICTNKKQKAFNDIILVSEIRQNLTYSRMIGNKRSCSIVSVSELISYHTERGPLFYYLNKWVFGDTSGTDRGMRLALIC